MTGLPALAVVLLVAGGGSLGAGFASHLWPPSPFPLSSQVVLPRGTVVYGAGPGPWGTDFAVRSPGGRLVGVVRWDHRSAPGFGVDAAPAIFLCPAELLGPHGVPVPPTSSGPAWTQTIDRPIAPGHYYLGLGCPAGANATVVVSIEILYG